ALALAKGSPRHDVLAKIAAGGPRAVEERPLGAELLALCGRPAGGLLTSDDLSSQRPEVHAASRHVLGGSSGGRASRGPSSHGPRASGSSSSRKGGAAGADENAPRFIIELPWANAEGGMPVPPAGRVEVATARAV